MFQRADDHDLGVGVDHADFAQRIQAVVLGHHQIERADIGLELLVFFEGLLSVGRLAHDFPARLDGSVFDLFANDQGVVDNQ